MPIVSLLSRLLRDISKLTVNLPYLVRFPYSSKTLVPCHVCFSFSAFPPNAFISFRVFDFLNNTTIPYKRYRLRRHDTPFSRFISQRDYIVAILSAFPFCRHFKPSSPHPSLITCIFIGTVSLYSSRNRKCFHFDSFTDTYSLFSLFLKHAHFSICQTNLCHSLAHFQTANASLDASPPTLRTAHKCSSSTPLSTSREKKRKSERKGENRSEAVLVCLF